MPTVPTKGREVTTAPLPGKGLQADVSAPVSRAAPVALGLAADIVQEETKKANQVATLEADVLRSQFETELLHDPETGALNIFGKNALGAYEPTLEAYDKKVGEISTGLANDAQRLAFNNRAALSRVTIDKQLQQHGSRESLRYDNETTQSWLTNGLVVASENYEDTEAVNRYIAESKAVLIDHAKRNGKSGEWLKQEKLERESKTHKAVIAQMLADGDDLAANEYFKKHGKNIIDDANLKMKLGNASTEGEASRIAAEEWNEKGPKTDIDSVDADKMIASARKKSSDPDVIKTVITNINQRTNLHNSSAQERTNANISAVWKSYNSDEGASLTQITTMSEYQALSGTDQNAIKNSIKKAEDSAGRVDREAQKIDQEIRRQELAEDLSLLREADLDQELREGSISRGGFKSLERLLDPKKSPSARAAFKRIDDSKTKRIFSKDANTNEKEWVEATKMLHDFLEANPEGDPAAFVDEIMQPIELKWKEGLKNLFSLGFLGEPGTLGAIVENIISLDTPGTERVKEKRAKELRQIIGQPTQAVQEGITATNPKTGERLIFKDGKWQLLTK